MKKISILGSTGSIGTQSLEIIKEFPEQFQVLALSCGRNTTLLRQQIIEFSPELVCVHDEEAAILLAKDFPKVEVLCGDEGLVTAATLSDCNLLVVAIFGTTALLPCYKAIEAGIPIGLACKEILVSAGEIMMDLAKKHGVPIIPIDSEHAALKQCLVGIQEEVSKANLIIRT